jgi:simple sugar transport system permease protein
MLSKLQRRLRGNTHEFFLLLIVLAFAIFLVVMTGGRFLTPGNLTDMLVSNAPLGIMAAGVLVVIISGGIDISFLAVATVAQYLMGLFMLHVGGNMLLTFLIPMAVGVALGCINALLVHNLKAPTIIITIATMNLYYGVLMWASKGTWLYGFPQWFSAKGKYGSILLPVGTLAVVFLLTVFILRRTAIGRNIFALGDNAEAARRAGIGLPGTQVFVYAYMGAVAALGAVVQTSMIQNIAPNALIGREMDVLAMVVLGGAALTGGRGTVSGTFLGLILVAMIGNGLTLMGISSYWHTLCMGAVILVSFCLTGVRSRKRKRQEVTSA